MPLPALVFVVFLTLKLTEVIDWSWWWITAPLWGCLAFILASMLFAGVIWGIWAKGGGMILKRFSKQMDSL